MEECKMGKAKFSPSTIFTKAMDIYLRDENITTEEMIKSMQDVDLRLKTVAFALRTMLPYHGYRVESEIADTSIIFKCAGMPCHEIEDKQLLGAQDVRSFCFKLVIHWGAITTQLDRMGQVPDADIKDTEKIQTALVI